MPRHYDNLTDQQLMLLTLGEPHPLFRALAERLAMRNRDIEELAREHQGLYKQYLILDGENDD